MRKLPLLTAAIMLCAGAAHAELTPEEYAKDRDKALQALTPELAKRCLSDFAAKDKDHRPIGKLVYNDLVSRGVYQEIYWKAGDRGVAFTAPVKTGDNWLAGDVGCFYSMTDKGLKFELSQWLHKF